MKQKILIIGGRGYIGSKLCTEFVHNAKSVDLNLFSDTLPDIVENMCVDYYSLSHKFLQKFDHIILLAGHSSVRMCDLYPESVFNNNVRNFVNLLHKLSPSQTLIYAGSGSVYGNCKAEIADEEYLFGEPYNTYDLTKQMIDMYYKTSGIKGRIFGLRFGTVNGYSPVVRDDIMINAMVSTAWKDNRVLLYNPDTRRSILGTNDLVRAMKVIMDSGRTEGGIYNVCSFTKTSGEMAKDVSDRLGCKLEIVIPEEINTTLNEKLVSSKYDFALSCEKFSNDFSFKFMETSENIIDGLVNNKEKIILTNRHKSYEYK